MSNVGGGIRPAMMILAGVLLLLIVEALLCGLLIGLYRWVELSVCASDFIASGHCYATWFGYFEAIFYALSLCLLAVTPLCVCAVYLGCYRLQLQFLHGLFIISSALLVLLVVLSKGRFWWQALLAILFAKWMLSVLLACGAGQKVNHQSERELGE